MKDYLSPGLAKRSKGAAWAAFFLAFESIAGAQASRLAGEVDARGLRDVVTRQKARVVLVNFWATWCVPCREEFPDLVRLEKTLRPKGLAIVGVSTDFAKEMPAVETFLAKMNPGFPNYHKKAGGDDQDFINAVDKAWGGELPFSVLYDGTGKKIKTLSGKHTYKDYEREIAALLK